MLKPQIDFLTNNGKSFVLASEIDLRLPATLRVRVMERLDEIVGLPKVIRIDNGRELRSAIIMFLCGKIGISLKNISSPVNPNKKSMLSGLILRTTINAN
jgi:putative transposase